MDAKNYFMSGKVRHLTAEQAFDLRAKGEEFVLEKFENMSDKSVVEFLQYMDLDEATSYLFKIPAKRRSRVSKSFNKYLDKKVEFLDDFDLNLVEKLMDFNYVEVDVNDSINLLKSKLKYHEERAGRFPTILVLSKGKILGSLPGHVLSFVEDATLEVGSLVNRYLRNIPIVDYRTGSEGVVDKFVKNEKQVFEKAVVVDHNRSVIGILYVDALVKLMKDRSLDALYDFAGVDDQEVAGDKFSKKFKLRHRWLLLNLGTTFLAAGVVSLFEPVLSRNVLLAAFMPVVAGMGGNAGTQTLAVMVRSLSSEDKALSDLRKVLRVWRNEVMAGSMNGLMTGVLVALIAGLLKGDWLLGLVVGTAVVINLVVSATFGTLVPFTLKKFGKDPATSATIFITTATDVFGFVAFLGFASLVF